MKRIILTLFACLSALFTMADSILFDSFEYANQDFNVPIGWTCDDASWLCGYLEKDHNRIPHHGNWYAFTNADDSWMFMPTYLNDQLKYRFSYWAISDGSYTVEFWAGNGASQDQMSQLLFTAEINSGEYEYFSSYIEELSTSYEFFGIHAIASPGASYCTIDEVSIDMVNKYDLEINPYSLDTLLLPGSTITFEFTVQNTGYEALHVYMTPYTDSFSDISFTEDGFNYSSFPTEPNQMVTCTCTATLNSNVVPGSRVWMDIMFTVSCDCITRMTTLWVDVIDETYGVAEEATGPNIFPNPAQDHIQINANGLSQVQLFDITGRLLRTVPSNDNTLQMDLNGLKPGVYFINATSTSGSSTHKIIKL